MRAAKSSKAASDARKTVAVVASAADLRQAARLRRWPDLFELRLDALAASGAEVDAQSATLRAPLIVTARHPAEGGAGNFTAAERRALLLRFLPGAQYIDVELRSLRGFSVVLREAARLKLKVIVSVHDFSRTPSLRQLETLAARAAAASADVFKLATRVDTPEELARLIAAFDLLQKTLPVSAMGIGRYARESRAALIARGSALNYAHLGQPQADGQLSLAQLRRLSRSR